MKTVKNDSNFELIEDGLLVLSKDITDKDAINNILLGLKGTLPEMKFKINVIVPKTSEPLFVMSVYPEKQSTLNKCVDAIVSGKDEGVVKDLWEKNTDWVIEIDSRLFSIGLDKKEVSAILFHELGHVVYSNYFPHVISTILRYELMSKKLTSKIMIKSNYIAKKIMSLPILNACTGYKRADSSIKEELEADKFVVKLGYKDELKSALTKLTSDELYKKNNKKNSMLASSRLTDEALEELKIRKGAISKSVLSLKKESLDSSIYLSEYFFSLDYANVIEYFTESSIADNTFDDIFKPESVFLEFFGMKKDLEKIDSMIIDYILVKINDMKSEQDRMMILSYIHSKLDLVNYYLEIYADKKERNKYNIPNNEAELKIYRQELYELRKAAIDKKIPESKSGLLVQWAQGYEG